MSELPLLQLSLCYFVGLADDRLFDPWVHCTPALPHYDDDDFVWRAFEIEGDSVYLCGYWLEKSDEPVRVEQKHRVNGDFAIVQEYFLGGPTTWIPCPRGIICRDVTKWRRSSDKLLARIIRVLDGGCHLSVLGQPAVVPRELLPASEYSDALVRKVFDCEVIASVENRAPVVRPIGPIVSLDEWLRLRRRVNPSADGM